MENFVDFLINNDSIEDVWNKIYGSQEKLTAIGLGGHRVDNPNLKETPINQISTLEVLKELAKDCEAVYNFSSFGMNSIYYEEDKRTFYLDDVYTKTSDMNNSYNWSSPLTNDINWNTFYIDDNGTMLVILNIQDGCSDVRTGYYMQIGLLYNSKYWSFITKLANLEESTYKSFSIDDFSFSFNIFDEYGKYDIYNENLNIEIESKYIGDVDDCKQWIKDKKYLE